MNSRSLTPVMPRIRIQQVVAWRPWFAMNIASATAAAETLRGELSRARDALASGAEEQERLGLELERAREEEARLSLSLEQAKHALETFTTASSAEVSRLAAELEAATSAKTAAEEALAAVAAATEEAKKRSSPQRED